MNFFNFDNNTEDNFYDKDYSEIDNNSTIVDNILKNNKSKPINENLNEKLTHNDCILIYSNPNISSKNKFKTALNHINECEVCKNEISKKNNMREKDKKNVSFKSDKNFKENFVHEKKDEKPIIIEKNNDYVKILQDEQNLKYQNLMLENTMSKYLENIEERKKLNDNIEKILTLLKKNKTNDEKDFNYQSGYNNITTNNLFLYFLFFVIIVLLIIDIFIKIKN